MVLGHLRVEEVPGRNRNFRVRVTPGAGLFLKQAPPEEPDANRLAVEAQLYRIAASRPPSFPAGSAMPVLVRWNPSQAILITELLENRPESPPGADEPWSSIPRGLGPALAAALRATHQVLPRPPGNPNLLLAERAPWVLEIGRPAPSHLASLTGAHLELLQVIQRDPAVQRHLDQLAASWAPVSLIHGDIKWANVLTPPGGGAELRLVDWETAQWGDPLWDLAGAMHSYLADILVDIGIASDRGRNEAATAFAGALPVIQGEIKSLWATYWSDATPDQATIERVVQLTAARLLQSGYEWCQGEDQIPRHAVAASQLSFNLLNRPAEGAATVLGLAPGATR